MLYSFIPFALYSRTPDAMLVHDYHGATHIVFA